MRAEQGARTRRLPRLAVFAITALGLLTAGCGMPLANGASGGPAQPAPTPAGPGGGSGGGPAPTPAAPQYGSGGGLVGGAGFAEGSGLLGRSDAELVQELDGIAATGATYLRVDFYWSGAEPANDRFYWGEIERVVTAARARNLKVLAMLAYTPAWARPAGTSDHHPPTNPADYADYAAAAVEHFAPLGVRDWEIWNEPNLWLFWEPRPNPAAYTRLLVAAYDAIKAVDAGANVISAGLSPAPNDGRAVAPVTFLEAVYANGGGGHFDAVAHHPSNYPNMPLTYQPDFNDNAFGGVTPKLHETMVKHGDGAKKIWATEMGAPTVDDMTPQYLADYLTEAYAVWKSWSFTGPLLWFSYRDGWSDPHDSEANYGLVRTDGTPKEPALSAYRAAIRN